MVAIVIRGGTRLKKRLRPNVLRRRPGTQRCAVVRSGFAAQRRSRCTPRLLAPAAAALRSGDAAPAFVGENYDGSSVTLASATGPKGLVLWFYPKAGTGG